MSSSRTGLNRLLRLLVAYRLLFYLGGLIAISLPLGLAWLFDIELQSTARTTLVGVSFAVILLTYIAERQVGLDHVDPRTGEATEHYSLRMRVSVAFGILGLAAGFYFVLAARPAIGLLFLVGAVLFFQLATRETTEVEEA